jgi:predicted nucleotidyltransferase
VQDSALIDEAIARLVRVLDPARIVLFGSRAGGEGGPDADLDLLVVADEVVARLGSRSAAAAEAYLALAGLGVAKDLIVATRADLSRWSGTTNHVVARACREGVVVHGRP